ncbi:MAG: hypothetical protein CVV64_11865 [Candidatus Wallbacteria bacterium HGW-Wallbacteria-1]|jgi:formylmethanofuran dehydrogenase subunit E|uniref:Formylmethanofuran dehydrogenase subunit E domain-containing protein n=1 Tax=Candidatus Wallbacteria bacterium HGW-Wallbacteria-1 TaxID=2013854 RepID=A0A2N1PP09_9BACT|nr:MAG: hypothetical protein CVV64_11865 [Candidatus Wallbacteria bacterium HGW-Wallbacteria-1]
MDDGFRDLYDLGTMTMPFGKYAGRALIDLPEPYVVWMNRNSKISGRLGHLFGILYEVKLNGLESMVRQAAGQGVLDAVLTSCSERGQIMNHPQISFDEVAQFHGHQCPGLAMGYRMTLAAMQALRCGSAEDEDLVAIVENDACGVDALQFMSGCTFGKGNLIFRDWGKHVYTLIDRETGRAVRVAQLPGTGLNHSDRDSRMAWILLAPEKEFLSVTEVSVEIPRKAVIRESENCVRCGESVMVSRLVEVSGGKACIPCSMSHQA